MIPLLHQIQISFKIIWMNSRKKTVFFCDQMLFTEFECFPFSFMNSTLWSSTKWLYPFRESFQVPTLWKHIFHCWWIINPTVDYYKHSAFVPLLNWSYVTQVILLVNHIKELCSRGVFWLFSTMIFLFLAKHTLIHFNTSSNNRVSESYGILFKITDSYISANLIPIIDNIARDLR